MTTYMQGSEGKIIPPSQRPDGTWRKARRVKEGYVPQEEVPLYESKGKLFAQRKPTGPVGGGGVSMPARVPYHQQPTPGLVIIKPSRPAKPKKEPQPQQQQSQSKGKQSKATNSQNAAQLATQMDRLTLSPEEKDPEKLVKHLKKLRKKLREIDNIEQKIKSGEIKSPDKDQLDKVARKKIIRTEFERLEKHPLVVQQGAGPGASSPT